MAKYDLKKPDRVQNAQKYLDRAIKNGDFIEIKKIEDKSLSINNYFHVIVAYYAMKIGYTIRHVKQKFIKTELCPDIFIYERPNPITGEMYKDVKSWADIDSHNAHTVVSRFLHYSSTEAGIRLPEPQDLIHPEAQREIKEELEQHKEFLY